MNEPTALWERLPWHPDCPITQPFGGDHLGVDAGPRYGVPEDEELIYAPYPCKVKLHVPGDGYGNGTFGNHVVLDGGDDFPTTLAHLKRFLVADGYEAKTGDPLGVMGYTGLTRPAGPGGRHTHAQRDAAGNLTRDIAICRDPLLYLEDDLLTANMKAMLTLATGNFDKAKDVYNVLVQKAVIDEMALTGGHLDPASDDLNSVLTRWRVLENVAYTNADAAVAALSS
jgi:hypothetical protein